MDELLETFLKEDNSAGANALCYLDITSATDIQQITHGCRIPCAPVFAPFSNRSPEELYDFWKANVCGSLTSIHRHWPAFMFAILDEQSGTDKHIVLCSDASDFREGNAATGEDEVKLKCIRLTFSDFVRSMAGIEMLTLTPSETTSGTAMNVTPPVAIDVEETTADGFRGEISTPERMRVKKRAVIWQAEADGWLEKYGN